MVTNWTTVCMEIGSKQNLSPIRPSEEIRSPGVYGAAVGGERGCRENLAGIKHWQNGTQLIKCAWWVLPQKWIAPNTTGCPGVPLGAVSHKTWRQIHLNKWGKYHRKNIPITNLHLRILSIPMWFRGQKVNDLIQAYSRGFIGHPSV